MSEYYAGKGCKCSAYGECECACGADWTDPEVYKLRADLDKARVALKKLARLGNEPHLGNSDGNLIAQAALKQLEA